MSYRSSPRRRSVLTTIATGGLVAVGGCASRESSESGAGALSDVRVEGTELVVEYESETSATGLAVIAPSGEAFAERALTPGASLETIPLGMSYPPGTYTVQLVDADRVVAAVEQLLRPDVVIRELKLARNHPDEMYEGAASLTITGEVIVDLENVGTGPEKLTKLQFDGDVPQPTLDELSESGIAAVDKPVTYTEPVIGSGERRTIYSRTLPFGPRSEDITCTPEGTSGRFGVSLTGEVGGKLAEQEYNVTYQGENLSECQITIERIDT
ncbi:hypothetical protein [Halorubrum kocurii]|uniref:Uncharacterized protein n=1 Tax=Halorubrum kocurii JCM 14978 TaxID=1230456 RepID=M0NHF2_9EURY|nr:hypothetical protein [Halorubrum kocurii]EMA56993.1 hypothetical protein C468_17019 [Halorubrum kocurii JCM 14978]